MDKKNYHQGPVSLFLFCVTWVGNDNSCLASICSNDLKLLM